MKPDYSLPVAVPDRREPEEGGGLSVSRVAVVERAAAGQMGIVTVMYISRSICLL